MTRTRRKPRQRPEEVVQRHCIGILRAYVPSPPDGPAWTAINPVSAKSKAVAGKSKAMGLRAGWPDLEMLHQGRAIYVEFKAPKGGRVDPEQNARHREIVAAGGTVHIARSIDEFLRILACEGVPCQMSNNGRKIANDNNTPGEENDEGQQFR